MDGATLFDSPALLDHPPTGAAPLPAVTLSATPPISAGDPTHLDRARVVDLILSVNKTVAREFLDQFKDASLRRYLAHLESAERPRNRHASWERPGDSPAVIGRESML